MSTEKPRLFIAWNGLDLTQLPGPIAAIVASRWACRCPCGAAAIGDTPDEAWANLVRAGHLPGSEEASVVARPTLH